MKKPLFYFLFANFYAFVFHQKLSDLIYTHELDKNPSIDKNELYETIASLLDCKKDAIHREEKVGDIKQSMADISKIKKYLGYDPSYSYKEGLKLAINWYKEFFSK